ncbi:MAG: lysylphosphatidylglycerol synthase transmembrane domain-containing protein [Anaerolineae bacterium]|nr:lysylphosphatidylglycerol synthase transmembrane domain-containing protein [Anaerolineae bacterium]
MLPLLFSVGLVALLLSQISINEVIALLAGVSPSWLAVGGLCYVVTNIFRAFRFAHLLPFRPARFLTLLAIAFALSMFNNVLPSRGGEVTFIYMMQRQHDMPAGEAAAVLVVARIFDVLAVAALFVVTALLSLSRLPGYAPWIVLTVTLFLTLTMAVLVAIPWLGQRVLELLERLLGQRRLKALTISALILRVSRAAVRAFQAIRSVRTYALTGLWSLLIWLGTFVWFWAFLAATGMRTDAAQVIVGATFAVLSKAIPFITVGGLGAHEAGWAVGFMLVGFDRRAAIASGFAVNILTLLVSLLCGGLALIGLLLDQRRKHDII